MSYPVSLPQIEQLHKVAQGLIDQSTQMAQAGLSRQALGVLGQVWTITADHAPALANAAAWGAAGLCLRIEAYQQAADWFARIVPPADAEKPLWSLTQQSLAEICRKLAMQSEAHRGLPQQLSSLAATSEASVPLPGLDIQSLGTFRVRRAGQLLPVSRAHKPIAVFRYLLAQDGYTAHKEALMDLLWPQARPREAAHSLHVAINMLRQYLDAAADSYLLFEDGHYCINPAAPLQDDVRMFLLLSAKAEQWWHNGEVAQAQHAFLEAVGYYRGDYHLDKMALAWSVAERERLLLHYLSVLDHLAQTFITQGRLEQAITYYQRLIERDSYREDAYRQLMRCYWQLGRRSEALRQYEHCATILLRDLSIKPMPETIALYQQCLDD